MKIPLPRIWNEIFWVIFFWIISHCVRFTTEKNAHTPDAQPKKNYALYASGRGF